MSVEIFRLDQEIPFGHGRPSTTIRKEMHKDSGNSLRLAKGRDGSLPSRFRVIIAEDGPGDGGIGVFISEADFNYLRSQGVRDEYG